MAETLVLRMPEDDRLASWLVVDAFGNRMGQPQTGTLAESAHFAAGRRLRVCVSGTAVVLLRADVPSSNAQKIMQAVPFALEDKLAEDIDVLHFAVGVHDAGGYPVAVVTRVRMQKWLDELSAAGLVPAELLPDFMALPIRAHTLIVVPDGHQLLARLPDGSGITAETSLMPLMLRRHLSTLPASETCTQALVYSSEEEISPETHEMLAGLQLETTYRPLNGGAIALMTASSRDSRAINLLQGNFDLHTGATDHWRRWRMAAMLFLAFSSILVVQQGLGEYKLRREADSLNSQITALFHQALPDVSHIVDPQAQMKQRLTQLTGAGENSESLLAMLTAVGDVLQSQHDVQLQSFSYHDSSLQLQVQAGNIDALNNMKSLLAQNSSLHVEMDSLNSSAGTTTGRLTISGGGG